MDALPEIIRHLAIRDKVARPCDDAGPKRTSSISKLDSSIGAKSNSGKFMTQWQKGANHKCGICAGPSDAVEDLEVS
jgi:hypothetical protein